ncbi:MAG: Anti-sigma-B factor antagonist [Anaerolineales bacterium]|nr:Anti-sigma-B factor antagonist [Anaerolineales bacterium]
MEIEELAGARAVVKLEGRLDANSADEAKTTLKNAAAAGETHLVVDMADVNFIDSSGLSALVSGFKAAREQGGTLALVNVGPQIEMALKLTRLNRVFAIYDDVESALASFEV